MHWIVRTPHAGRAESPSAAEPPTRDRADSGTNRVDTLRDMLGLVSTPYAHDSSWNVAAGVSILNASYDWRNLMSSASGGTLGWRYDEQGMRVEGLAAGPDVWTIRDADGRELSIVRNLGGMRRITSVNLFGLDMVGTADMQEPLRYYYTWDKRGRTTTGDEKRVAPSVLAQ